MKKIILLLLYFAFPVQIFCQPDGFKRPDFEPQHFPKFIFTQSFIIPEDSLSTVYFFYKVPYQHLVFLKNGEKYNAELRLDVEVTDTNSNFVKREIKDWKPQASSFEETNSLEQFAEGFISLKLSPGYYNILPIITDHNSKREIKTGIKRLDIFRTGEVKNISPVIVYSKKIPCDETEYFRLTNFENDIPFGLGSQDIIIPVKDISIQAINITVVNQKDTILRKTVNDSFLSAINFRECSGKILLDKNGYQATRNFIISGLSNKLKEGYFSIIINDEKEKPFSGNVFWYDKPASLRNPEMAIKALKYIEGEPVIDSLLDLDEEEQYKCLVNYWKKMDPTPETEFNELMSQYYARVDYAQINFSSITGIKGIDTDRGKIYVKFGKPDQVERSSNEKGKIVETWVYEKEQRRFVFVDRQGVGEFSLENS